MYFTKQKVKNILIIVLSVFVLVPLVCMLFDINPVREGMNEWAWGSKNKKMDRVDVNGINLTVNGADVTGADGEYLYCIAGNITCPDGSELSGNDVSYTNYAGTNNMGSTYDYLCKGPDGMQSDASHVQCGDNKISEEFDRFPDLSFVSETNQYDIFQESTINGIADTSGHPLIGFTNPYSYIPLEISGDYVYLYKSAGQVDFVATPCFLYETSDNDVCIDKYYTDITTSTTTTVSGDTDTTTTVSGDTDTVSTSQCSTTNIPCMADNGQEVGDPLCCGQSGVVQSTEYNCPKIAPYCVGYKCGTSWGTCQTSAVS